MLDNGHLGGVRGDRVLIRSCAGGQGRDPLRNERDDDEVRARQDGWRENARL